MKPLVQIPVSGSLSCFQRISMPVGMGLTDGNLAWISILRKWIGPWFAEPRWDGANVAYSLRDESGQDVLPRRVQPVSAEDVEAALKTEFSALRENLETARPSNGMERTFQRLVLDRLKRLTGDPQKAADAGVFFKYRDASGRWRLAWCWGYERTTSSAGKLAVCPAEDCRTVTALDHKTARCPRCEAQLGKSRRLNALLAALVLILSLAGGGAYWISRDREPVPMEGTVFSAVGPNRPIAGAKVRLAGTDITAATDQRGRFRLNDLSAETGVLEISAPGFRAETLPFDLAQTGERTVKIGLKGAGELRGVVLGKLTGQPIPQARVSLPGFHLSTLTNQQGAFYLADVPGESAEVVVSAGGFQEQSRIEAANLDSPRPSQWHLLGAGRLAGIVIDALTLEPIPRAAVYVQGTSLREQTDAGGRFDIAGLPSGDTTIAVQAPGYLPEHLGRQLAGAEVSPIRVGLHGSGVRMGIVRSQADGRPIAGALIRLPQFGRTVKTNELGEYELTKVPPGDIAIRTEAAGFRSLETTIHVQGDSAPLPFGLVGNASLSGTIQDAVENTPLEGVEIRVVNTNLIAKTEANGRFRLTGIPARASRVQILGKGYQLVEREHAFSAEKEETVEVSLKGGTILSGTIQDAATQAPIAGAEVELADTSRKTHSDSEGRFRFDDVVAGPVKLTVAAAGYRPAEQAAETRSGEETQISLPLRGDTLISGTVIQSDDDSPLAGVKLKLTGTSRQATTDELGHFRFADVPSGLVVLEAELPGYEPAVITRNLAKGDEAPLKVALLGAAELTGRIVDSSGQGVANATVNLEKQGIETTTDSLGRFQMRGLIPREVQIQNLGPGISTATGDRSDFSESTDVAGANCIAARREGIVRRKLLGDGGPGKGSRAAL